MEILGMSGMSLWRVALAIGGLGLFLALEARYAFTRSPVSRLFRGVTNITLGVGNAIIVRLLFSGFLFSLAQTIAAREIGILNRVDLPLVLEFLIAVALLDFGTYVLHVLYHRVPPLWRIHRIHHSDPVFDVTTAVRFHPVEIILSMIFRIGFVITLGVSGAAIALFEMTLLFASQFQHSDLRLPDRIDSRIRWIWVTPNMHRIHHSVKFEELDSNYSTIFTWWDRLLGTYRADVRQESIRVGLSGYTGPVRLTLMALLMMPLGPLGKRETLRSRGDAVAQ